MHIIGPRATDLIAEGSLAIEAGLSVGHADRHHPLSSHCHRGHAGGGPQHPTPGHPHRQPLRRKTEQKRPAGPSGTVGLFLLIGPVPDPRYSVQKWILFLHLLHNETDEAVDISGDITVVLRNQLQPVYADGVFHPQKANIREREPAEKGRAAEKPHRNSAGPTNGMWSKVSPWTGPITHPTSRVPASTLLMILLEPFSSMLSLIPGYALENLAIRSQKKQVPATGGKPRKICPL